MVTWDAANEAKLFALILHHADVKVTGEMLKKCADDMGDGCTAKAITHRLAKLKAAGNQPTSTASKVGSKPATPVSTPNKATKSTPRKRKIASPVDGEDEEAAAEDQSPSKKVKAEAFEEV